MGINFILTALLASRDKRIKSCRSINCESCAALCVHYNPSGCMLRCHAEVSMMNPAVVYASQEARSLSAVLYTLLWGMCHRDALP